jgi:predicted PurR-regulated permease PerM
MAGGYLFGFIGILLALPVSAVCNVVLKHMHAEYLKSKLYGPPKLLPEAVPERPEL